MTKISGFGNISHINSTFGIITSPGYPKIIFTAKSTTSHFTQLTDTFGLGEKVGFTGEKLETAQEGCNFMAHYVRKISEISGGTGKIETVQETHGILSTLETGEKRFFPGRNFKKESGERDLKKILKEGDLVDFLAIPVKSRDGGIEMIAIEVSFKKYPALVVYRQSGYSVLWSKYHGKIFCPGNLLEEVAKEQALTLGSWVKCSLEHQEPKNGTHWMATEVSAYRFSPESFVICTTGDSFSARGIGLICASHETDSYLWNEFIGRICFKEDGSSGKSAKRLKLVYFEAKFQLNFTHFDQAWVATRCDAPFSRDVAMTSTVKFGCGEVVNVNPTENYGFIHVPSVGNIYFRRSDYDGREFDQLKGKKGQVMYVDSYNRKGKGAKSHRALFVVEDTVKLHA